MKKDLSGLNQLYKLLITIGILWIALYYGKSIIAPLIFSFFFALGLYPMVHLFQRYVRNRVLAIFLSMLIVIAIIGAGIYLLSSQLESLLHELPSLQDKFLSFFNSITNRIETNFHYTSREQMAYLRKGAENLLKSSGSIIGNTLTATSSVFSFLSLIPIYVFFILLYQDNFKLFLISLRNKNGSNYLEIVSKIRKVVQGYISGMGLVIIIIATLNCIGLFSLGIKYALFFGIFSAILTIIPYIGIAIGATLPAIFALITKDSLWYPIGVLMVYALVQFLEGNFITPKIVGNKVNINPLAAIIALIIGGSLWGIPGMILAIPTTGIIQILLNQNESTKPYSILLRADSDKNIDDKQSES